jgi:hypothetical protein
MIEGYVGSCDIIPSMTEYSVQYPELCYERCLETAECRGVTYDPTKLECYYHICDCHLAFTGVPGFKFMWKYCLESKTYRYFSKIHEINLSKAKGFFPMIYYELGA